MTTDVKCMCCGETIHVSEKFPRTNMSAYVECPSCFYEHRTEIRNNKIVYVGAP